MTTDAEIDKLILAGWKKQDIIGKFDDVTDCRIRKRRIALEATGQSLPHLGGKSAQPAATEFAQPRPSLPAAAPEAGGPSLPDPIEEVYEPYIIDQPGWWMAISDIHLPYHDRRTIETAVREAESRDVTGIILDGDVFDFYQLSTHYREPDKARTKEGILKGRALFEWLRSRFPKKRIVMLEGNHDERLRRYLAERAPEIFDLEEVHLPALVHAENYGLEWVRDRRIIELGKLCVLHGHEYQGGGGVMPARWMFIRAWSNALFGHFHHPSHFTGTTLDRREIGCWSMGCACFLYPFYRRKNNWRHGYAMIDLARDGTFKVDNREILKDGKVVRRDFREGAS